MRRESALAADALLDHRRLASTLSPGQRDWLARMADVLPPGWVVVGMAIPRRAMVYPARGLPGGLELIHAPAGPSGVSTRRPISPTRGELPTLAIEYAPW